MNAIRRVWACGARIPAACWWGGLALWSGVIFWISHHPVSPEMGEALVAFSDKALHVGAYGLWASLCFAGFARSASSWSPAKSGLLTFVLTVLYGISDEYHQSFVPERTSEWPDVAADAVGAALAVVGWTFIARLLSAPVVNSSSEGASED